MTPKTLKNFILLFLFLIPTVLRGQLITKKESQAINSILTETSEKHKPGKYLFKNVSVLTMKDSILIKNQNILVENGVIKEIGSAVTQTPGSIVIDGTGKYLMPGLTDMHVHLFENHPLKNTWFLHLLVNGVTSVRDMCGQPEKLILREKIRKNEIIAPSLYQAGPIINGFKDQFGFFALASTPQQGREIVIKQKAEGYDLVKVYDELKKEVYEAILNESKKQGMLVAGHVPNDINISDVVKNKQNTIEHLTGYIEWKDHQIYLNASQDYAELTANSDTWNCPTLINQLTNVSRERPAKVLSDPNTSEMLPDNLKKLWEKLLNNNSEAVKEMVDKYGEQSSNVVKKIVLNLYQSKAKLISGTDSGNLPFMVPGSSLHEELKIMIELGIPIYDVLKMTTCNAAAALGKENEFGTVEKGKRADLLLLDKNPLEDINNLKSKEGLMIRGIWLSKKEIEEISAKMKAVFSNQ